MHKIDMPNFRYDSNRILNEIAGGETPESLSTKMQVPLAVIEWVVRCNLEDRQKEKTNGTR